jgi:hypothetical protein
MNNIIKALESIGQNNSIKQFESVNDLIIKSNLDYSIDAKLIDENLDLVCGVKAFEMPENLG